jgi:hypothetical protein
MSERGPYWVPEDPACSICGELKSKHVSTEKGPLTHPREARGEGTYKMVKPEHIQGGFWPGEEYEWPAQYEFVPTGSELKAT